MERIKLDTSNTLQLRLFSYLKDYHPYMLEDAKEAEEFIIQRAELANEAFIKTSNDGDKSLECHQAAMEVLHSGLEFSPITYLIEACIEATGYEMNNDEACIIYREPAVKEIFERYGTEIEGDPREHLLVAELKPFFKEYEGKGDMDRIQLGLFLR